MAPKVTAAREGFFINAGKLDVVERESSSEQESDSLSEVAPAERRALLVQAAAVTEPLVKEIEDELDKLRDYIRGLDVPAVLLFKTLLSPSFHAQVTHGKVLDELYPFLGDIGNVAMTLHPRGIF